MCTFLCCEGKILQRVTYEDALVNVDKLNTFFRLHIKEKSCILLLMEQSVHIPAIIMSLKACGHCFVPFSTSAKRKEIQDLVEEAEIQFVLSFVKELTPVENFQFIDDIHLGKEKCVILKKISNNHTQNKNQMQDDILCIIPSSGTTGKRKLIKIESYCIQQNVDSLNKVFNLNEKDVIYFGSPLTFDPSLVELLLALKVGASLIVVPEKSKLNHETLYRTLFPKTSEYPGPTFLQIVPSLFTRWSEKQKKYILNESKLKILAFGGEPFPLDILQFPRSLKLYNLYGITEVSCWATIHEIKGDKVFLGYPLEETFLKIYDKEKVIEEGIGELYIGSNTRFCYVDKENQKVAWRPTGDLVNKTVDGIKYLGRKNSWVKRFGNRICLNQIKNKIYENIKLSSEVIWFETVSKLLLFILIPSIYQEDRMRVLDKIRLTLLRVLSKEEFPDFFDIISTFPVTCNGKIDKNTLIEIYKQNETTLTNTRACDVFLILFSRYLGHSISQFDRIKNYTFFELGGNSILFTLLINNLKDILEYDLPSEFFSFLFDENIDYCVNYLKNFEIKGKSNKKRRRIEEIEENISEEIEIVWKYNLLGCVDASPLLFEENGNLFVAVGSFSGYFGVFNALSGEPIFMKQFPDSIGNKAIVCPSLNFLYFGCFDGNLYCINLDKKIIEWTYHTDNSIKCKPSFCEGKEALVFGSYDKNLHCISSKSGGVIWKTNIRESIVASPILHHSSNQILVTTLVGSCISVSEKTGAINWCIKLKNPIFGTPCLLNENELILVDIQGYIYRKNVINKVETKVDVKMEGEIYCSVIFKDYYLIITSQKGFLYKCNLKNKNYNCDIVMKLYLKEPISTTPCILEYSQKTFIIVFTNHGNLFVVNFESMEIVSQRKCSSDVYSSPVLIENKLYFGARDDNLYCLNIDSLSI